METLLYLHGFKSSSRGRKANELATALEGLRTDWELIRPDLPSDPAEAIALITRLVERVPAANLTIVGSSLGGFYALALAERVGCRAALLNPSLAPYETLAAYVGTQRNLHTDAEFEFTMAHVEALRSMAPSVVTRLERYLLIVEMGDALLDHTKTCAAFAGAQQVAVEGGSHDLASFPQHIPVLFKFAGLV